MTQTPRSAVLLAAGCARRLEHLTRERPKCLLEVGGRTLIEHQVDALAAAGVEQVFVVTGYHADKVEATLGGRARYVHNDVYDRTNSLYSLALALPSVLERGGGFVLTNADVLFHPALLDALLAAPAADALLYEPNDALGDEEMKIRVAPDGRVTAFAKTLPHGTYHGENLGVLRFSGAGARRLREAADALVTAGDVNAWAPKAFDAICAEHPLHAVPTRGLPWIEIDFPADLERARRVVWPRIEAAARARRAAGA